MSARPTRRPAASKRGPERGSPGRARKADAPAADTAAAAAPQPNTNTYLYGIVGWPVPEPLTALGTGVGDPPRPVRAVRHRGLAALVSDLSAAEMSAQGVRGMRRDMKAHAAVLNQAAVSMTVLPVRFGVVLPDERALVGNILEPQYQRLEEYLAHLKDAVEVTLRATYVEEEVLREVLAERPDLSGGSGGRGRRGGGYQSRLETGRQIAALIQDKQDHDARWLVEALAPVVRDVRVGKPLTDLMVLNASFLVSRPQMTKFDRRLAEIHTAANHRMQFDCVGPLPPYSFVDLRL